ncbi:MAG: PfkB family carbohydrate kinase [Pseudomonadota bacterium]
MHSSDHPKSNTQRTDFHSPLVLVLGGANMDISGSTTRPLVLSDSNPGRIRCAPGGVARNVAENLARLGNTTRLLTAVGDDLYGRSLLDATHKAGVDVGSVWVLAEEATSTYLSLHGPDGDMAVAVNDMGILDCITPGRLAPCAPWIQQAAALVVDCNVGVPALDWVFANRGSTPVFVEAVSAFKCGRIRPWLAQVHLLKVNRLEAQALCDFGIQSDVDIERAAQQLHTLGVEQVVLSLGERGVYWSARNAAEGWHAALPNTVVINATGAGDALMAGLVHAFVDKQDLSTAIPFALGCAALTVASAHANNPELSVAAISRWLHNATPL